MKHLAIVLFLLWQGGEPPEAMTLARRAYDAARRGNLDAAAADLLEAARLAPRNALYRSALGGLYARQNKPEEAIKSFREAVRLEPGNTALKANLETLSLDYGAALARERRFRAGLQLARETAALSPASAKAHIMLGLFETRNQQNVRAVAAYRRALELAPESSDASVGLGIAQSAAGMLKESQDTFEAGLRRFPQDAMHRQAYGVLLVKLAEAGGAGTERAIEMLQSALALDPALAEAHYQLGSLALAREDHAAAASEFAAALGNGLDDSRIHYALARLLRRNGKTEEAAKHLRLFAERKAAEQDGRQP
ncbi:MAG: tetratricopeptide repeat protein [Bryobacterales bacterium]|nr:tetratricopeptide repeat protein [Bryobacterales bacterium]